jgi:hypothetical protein
MTMMTWGRFLLLWGLAGVAVSFAPALILMLLPGWQVEMLRLIATMLTLTVTPLMAVIASVGAILLLVGVIRRGRP